MSSELNLSIALAAHANAYCHNCLAAAELASLIDGPAFRTVTALQFSEWPLRPPFEAIRGWLRTLRRTNGEGSRQSLSEVIQEWLASLRRRHTERLRLEVTINSTDLPPAIAAAFANTNPTAIVVSGDQPHMLLPRWSFSGNGGSQVVYYPFAVTMQPPAAPVDVAATTETLRRQLAQAREFALAQDQPHWDKYLSKASTILEESDPQSDLLPTCGYSAAAHRLASAASAAWVFGGMGSWNDMGFTDRAVEERYRQVTNALFSAVLDGYLVAANSFELPAKV